MPPSPSSGVPRRPSFFFIGAVAAAGAAASFAAVLVLGQKDLWERHAALEAEDIQWVVFLKEDADRAPVEDLLRVLPGLRSLRFISKDEALESVKADPVFAEGLSLTGGNPFPESFSARWSPLFLRPDLLEHHADRLRELPAVDHVDYDRPRVERFSLGQKALSRLDLAAETLSAVIIGLLLLMSGRLLFFSSGAVSPSVLFGGAISALLGAGLGVWIAHLLGAPAGIVHALTGAAAAAVPALAAEAFRT